MIVKYTETKDFLGREGTFTITQYFGNSILTSDLDESVKKNCKYYLGATCKTHNGEDAVVIGFEDNEAFDDYYWLLYVPSLDKVVSELYNDPEFYSNIKIF